MRASLTAVSWCAHGCAAIVMIAGVAKLVDISAFRASLDSWTLLKVSMLDAFAWALPIIELWLGALFITSRGSRWASLGVICLLTGFIATIVAHLAVGIQPKCGCLGKVSESASFLSNPVFLLGKAGLMWMIVVAHTLLSWKKSTPLQSVGPQSEISVEDRSQAQSFARGFTLTEVLVVVVIIGVLLSITVPAIGFARQSARMSQNLVAVRQAATAMTNYTSINKGQFIYPVVGSRDPVTVVNSTTGQTSQARYFDSSIFWPNVLAAAGVISSAREEWTYGYPIIGPSTGKNAPGQTFSCSLLAHSDYWNESTRFGDASQFVPPTIDIVAYPNKKIMFFNGADHQRFFGEGISSARHPKVSPPVAFVDGSARQVPSQRIQQGMLSGDGYWPLSTHPMEFYPGLHTINGARGMDVR